MGLQLEHVYAEQCCIYRSEVVWSARPSVSAGPTLIQESIHDCLDSLFHSQPVYPGPEITFLIFADFVVVSGGCRDIDRKFYVHNGFPDSLGLFLIEVRATNVVGLGR